MNHFSPKEFPASIHIQNWTTLWSFWGTPKSNLGEIVLTQIEELGLHLIIKQNRVLNHYLMLEMGDLILYISGFFHIFYGKNII